MEPTYRTAVNNLGYQIPSRITSNNRKKILKIMDEHHNINSAIEMENKNIRRLNKDIPLKKDKIKLLKPQPGTTIIKELKRKGLYYDKNSIYYDLRRTGATFNASTPIKRAKAQKWFDEYFEPLRKEKKISSKKAYELWERAKKQSYENMKQSELDFALELREMGSP